MWIFESAVRMIVVIVCVFRVIHGVKLFVRNRKDITPAIKKELRYSIAGLVGSVCLIAIIAGVI